MNSVKGRRNSREEVRASRADLAATLRRQAAEIETAIFNRVRDVSASVGDDDPSYVEGRRGAIRDAVRYALEGIEGAWEAPARIPLEIARQARRAARAGVRLDTVMRGYIVGNKALDEFIMKEAEGVSRMVLRQVLSDQGQQLDRLMEAVATEYRDEAERTKRSSAMREADRIARLLDSDVLTTPAELDYDFDLWHIGVILTGRDAQIAARLFAERLGFRSLHGVRDDEVVWVWLGSRRRPSIQDLVRSFPELLPAQSSVAIGEPREGLDGWRLTHREARVALQVMGQRPDRVTRGRDVVLLAGVLRDETLVRSLLDTYLEPLRERGSRAGTLRETLRAFFAASGNAAAAAETLGIDRHTVRQRIRAIEKTLDQPLHMCSAELQVALKIEELDVLPGGLTPAPRY